MASGPDPKMGLWRMRSPQVTGMDRTLKICPLRLGICICCQASPEEFHIKITFFFFFCFSLQALCSLYRKVWSNDWNSTGCCLRARNPLQPTSRFPSQLLLLQTTLKVRQLHLRELFSWLVFSHRVLILVFAILIKDIFLKVTILFVF